MITIITESAFEAQAVKKILDVSGTGKFEVLPADGFTDAVTKVKSLLRDPDKRILLLSSETLDPESKSDKESFLEEYIRPKFYPDNLKVIWAAPEFEIIFFQDKQLMEKSLDRKIPPESWKLAKSSPRVNLGILSGKPPEFFLKLLVRKEVKEECRKSTIFKEIIDFAALHAPRRRRALKNQHAARPAAC